MEAFADYRTVEQEIVNNLSFLIKIKMNLLHVEQVSPGCNPDDMDDKIKLYKKQINFLLHMRQEFECIMTDVIL
jgi:hypothetical protein